MPLIRRSPISIYLYAYLSVCDWTNSELLMYWVTTTVSRDLMQLSYGFANHRRYYRHQSEATTDQWISRSSFESCITKKIETNLMKLCWKLGNGPKRRRYILVVIQFLLVVFLLDFESSSMILYHEIAALSSHSYSSKVSTVINGGLRSLIASSFLLR